MKRDDYSFCCRHVNNSSVWMQWIWRTSPFHILGIKAPGWGRNYFLVEEAVLIIRPEIKWPGHLWGSCFHSNPMGGVDRAKAAKSNCFSLYLFVHTLLKTVWLFEMSLSVLNKNKKLLKCVFFVQLKKPIQHLRKSIWNYWVYWFSQRLVWQKGMVRKVRISGRCWEEKLRAFGSRSADTSVRDGWVGRYRAEGPAISLPLEAHSQFFTWFWKNKQICY